MSKISRNEPCPCGSGKKYKYCCLDDGRRASPKNNHRDYVEDCFKRFYDKYSHKELIKIFSVLQIQPKNHGKNIRIESITTEIASNYDSNSITRQSDYQKICKDIIKTCTRNRDEDPPEEFFTNTLVYGAGNNIVFPGIITDGVTVNQHLLETISYSKDSLPLEFTQKVWDGVRFILYVHHQIACEMGYSSRMYIENNEDEIYIPSISKLIKHKELFVFNKAKLSHIYEDLGIEEDIISNFSCSPRDSKLDNRNPDDNLLLRKPFIHLDDEYVLAMPTAELVCINEYIINLSLEYNCFDVLIKAYNSIIGGETHLAFAHMSWYSFPYKISEPHKKSDYFYYSSKTYQFDSDKIAYVSLVTGSYHEYGEFDYKTINNDINTIAKSEIDKIKKDHPDYKIFWVFVTSSIRCITGGIFYINETLNSSDESIVLNFSHLRLMTVLWDFDKLSLWKYVKYSREKESHKIFMPINTHLARYDWYERHEKSFVDKENEYSMIFIDFDVEGNLKRKGTNMIDKQGVEYPISPTKTGFDICEKKDKNIPLYISASSLYGLYRICLLRYSSPIWFQADLSKYPKAHIIIEALAYWCNELEFVLDGFVEQFQHKPIVFNIHATVSDDMLGKTEAEVDFEKLVKYSIDKEARFINIQLSDDFTVLFLATHNGGERYLMMCFIGVFNELASLLNLKTLDESDITDNIAAVMPYGRKKMILIGTTENIDIKASKIDTDEPRYIPLDNITQIAESHIKDLGLTIKPQILSSKEEKKQLLNSLVTFHYDSILQQMKPYDYQQLLVAIMRRHESILSKDALQRMHYPARELCYGKYEDVHQQYLEESKSIAEISLCLRVLVEFVACSTPQGDKSISQDELDCLLGRMSILINAGFLSDAINFDVLEESITITPTNLILFPSIGVLKLYWKDLHNEQFEHIYQSYLQKKNNLIEDADEVDTYMTKVDQTFVQALGVSLFNIALISEYISSKLLFDLGQSVACMDKSLLKEDITRNLNISSNEVDAYFSQFIFIKRDGVLNKPEGYRQEDVYPWRYSRPLSYLLRPIVEIEDGLLISARHLLSASQNFIHLFFNGTLKINNKAIQGLLAECNKIKGEEYREDIYDWLIANTDLEVVKHEVKIKPKGFFDSSEDKGDIDILALDHSNRIIYSIECKNTTQSKIPYDIKHELDVYLGTEKKIGLIQKHINRDTWLQSNSTYVRSKLSVANYSIKSLVISRNILPTTYVNRNMGIPIYSFYDLQCNNTPIKKKKHKVKR